MSITVRPALDADIDTLVAGNIAMALEAEHKRLDPATVQRGVRAVFEEPGRGRYFVAEVEGNVVGQAMITYEWSDWRNGTFWWI
jgi:hypothetical protein